MTIADKLKQIKQSTDAIKASATALTGEVQTDLTSIATELDTANPANATDILNMLGYNSTNTPKLYNALLSALNKAEGESYRGDTTVLLPKLILDENGAYIVESDMFKDSTILTVPQGKYRSSLGCSYMFSGCDDLLWIPDLEISVTHYSGTYSCDSMFANCSSLKTVGNLNTKDCNSMSSMFHGCKKLESIASLDTSTVVNMNAMFSGCTKLKSIPQLDTSNVTNMSNMFSDCSALENLPQLDTSKVTDMGYIFNGCATLISVPQLDYSSATNLNNGFSYCTGLTTIPDLNFESATNLSNLFYNSSAIITIGNLNTPKLTSTGSIVYGCKNLEKIASMDVQSVTTTSTIVGYSNTPTLKYMVLKNLGQSTATNWGFVYINNWGVNNDTHPDAKQSVIDTLITYSYDRASAGLGACSIKLSSTTKGLLTEEEIAQITAKGFTIG